MKILLTMNLPYTRAYGGANRSNRALAEALAARHHSVCVIVPALAAVSPISHQQFLEELTAAEIPVTSNDQVDIFNLNNVEVHAVVEASRLCPYLVEQIRDFEPDWTLVSSEDRSQSLLEAALRTHPSRVIYLAHTPQMFPFGPAGLYPGKRRTELVGQAARIVTISRFVADYIRKWTGFESFINHPPHFGSAPFPSLGSIENNYVLMMNACAVKGLSTFLALARALPDIRFAALPGWGTTAAERAVLGTLPNVVLMNNGNSLDDILRRTRVLLMPSLWVEGFGMAVVDAMLRGIPVLAANYGGLIEAKLGTDYLLPVSPIERFEDRLDENMLPVPLVPDQDILPWQNALSRLVSDRDLYERQSAAARNAALQFVGGLSIEPLETLLLQLLTKQKAGGSSYRGKPEKHSSPATLSDKSRTGEGIADLTPEQQALLMLRLRKKAFTRAKAEPPVPSIQPVSRDQKLPLSFAQQRLWFLDEYEPNSSLYNIPSALRLRGRLSVAALEQSISEIIRRHESLRTTFSTVEGELVQVISPAVNSPLSVVDLSDAAEGAREEEARRIAGEEARRPFDLARGPLFRSKLLRVHQQEHVLLLTMHHIVSDGWSMGILYRELAVLYGRFCVGTASGLPDLPVQYADFAVWQRQWLQGEVLANQLSYWKKQLEGIPAVLNLPTDRPRPAVQGNRGARQSIELSKDLSEGLKALSREEGATLFMTLLAGFQTLLHRHSGQDDIVVGSPIANRNRREIEGLIGFFLNTLVFRANFSENPTFKELLAGVRETALGAYAHQDLPFEKLVEHLKPERSLSHGPLFQVLFNMANQENSKLEFLGLTTQSFSSWEIQSKFDLTLYVTEEKDQIRFNLVYQPDLFSQARITCLLEQYKWLLEQIVASPQEPIRSYSLVTPESRQLLPDPTAVLAEPTQELITGLFLSWASRTPEQPAISHGRKAWSYGELARRAETVARVLRAHGVNHGEAVAVYGRPSFGLIGTAMGVLLSGGALLPVDPNLPDQRKQLMLRQSGARILVNIGKEEADDSWQQREADLTILLVDPDNGRCVVEESLDLALVMLPELAPDDPAYIFFTSGTTGVPRAVLGCHKGLSHFLHWQRDTFAIGPQDRVAQLTNLSFDPVLRDVFLPLSSGAVVCLPERAESLSADEILRWLESQQISVLHTVPSLAQAWLADSRTEVCLKRMRWVFFAGEPLTENLVRRWRATFPQSEGEIVNLYGPTETTLAKCFYRVPAEIPGGVQPVGFPLPETQALVLREAHQLCGIGEPGEIVLRTPYRTLGYINAPEENCRRFVKNPLRGDDRDLLYYTGDRGRYRPDGTLEIVGRLDDQVKIRGVRVEPDEVAAVLSQHPQVKASFVLTRRDHQDQNYLAAYVLPSEKDRVTVRQLRTYLSAQLPHAMIPRTLVFIEQLPLTPNVKVDRKSLPAPDLSSTESDSGYVAPRTAVEELLANLWASVLKLDGVGVHDNFFDLGGHSLLATQVISRANQAFQTDLSLRNLFEAPTVAELAERIERIGRQDHDFQRLRIVPVSRDKDLPLSFAQQRLWFLDQLEPNSSVYNISTALRLCGSLNVEALRKSIEAIVARHETLRTTFYSVDGEARQIIGNNPSVELAGIDLRKVGEGDRDVEIQRLLRQEARRPFKLSSDLMLRGKLLQLAEQEHVLLLVMHHIASDGWSMGVLFRELAALYDAFSKGESSPLTDLPIQYADFAVWQRNHLQGEILDTQLSYWKKQLAGAPFLLNLPTDRPRPAVQSHQGGLQSFILRKDLSEALKALSRRENVTLYMTLLAAFNALLYRYTGQDDLIVGTPIAGRNRAETEGLIGFFVNTLVVRTDLSGDPTFRELLDRVRERVLEAFGHQDLPFEKLVEALHPKRHVGHRSLVQVAFAFQNVPRAPIRFSGLAATPVPVDFELAKLDLTLFMWETEGELAGSLNYNADLFEPTTIVALINGFHVLLEAAVLNPDLPVEKLLSASASSTTGRKISREEAVDAYELSNLTRNQVLIWAGQKLHPELPTYNVPYQFIISGNLDADHFRKAFQTLVNSSDALRTVIREIDGLPQQTVLADLWHPVECLDFSGNENPVAAFKAWVEGRRHTPLDFREMPLDCALAKLSDREFVWYINVHHIVSDGWSVGLIFRWVGELYGRSVQMCLEDRIEIPAYRSYVDHERQYRRSQRYARAEMYWKEKLAEKLPPTTFYGKKPRKGTSQVHRISRDLGIDRTRLLKQLATGGDCPALSENASVFNVLAAILFAYLNRVTGLRRHSIGTPVHNRGSRGFNETIGLVMEVLPLRVTIEEDETFRSLILKVQLEASQVFRMCHNIGNSPQNKVYDVLLNYHIASYSSFHDIPVRVERLPTGQDNHSLALQVHDFHRSGSLSIEFDFHSDAFDPAQSRLAVDHFLRMLDAYLADPNGPISHVDLLSEEEKHCLLLEFNRSEVGSYDNICVHQLFERSVERTPDAVALVSHAANLAAAERLELTYSELNDRANKLAHYLRKEGVSRGDRVAVCLDRCAEAVVAILAVLKAGGAYVPLNPNYPADRLLSMLQDSRPAILLTHKQYAASVSVDGIGLICLDTDDATWAQEPVRNPTPQQTLDDSVYIVYTSGSTGRSKGVVVSHRSLVNAYLGWEEGYQLTSGHTHLQMANLSFDVFSGDLVRALCSGGKLVICPTEIMLQPALLFQLMREERVDWAEFVPPVLRELVAYAAANNCRLDFMRGIVCGSDIWSVEDYRQCQRLCGPKTRLINSYGVTEATIDSSFFEGALPNGLAHAGVPIGRRFSRTQLYILDRSMRPTPMGVPGELHIGGAGVARGYLNRPELTAEKFIADPFSSTPGARLYRTGDLARYFPDGNIEFLGRLDHQVKIRGFRIELGEIETVLRSHPAVQQVVVTARQDVARDDKLLVAYVVGSQPGSCSAAELHGYVKSKLPSYMLPATFVFLDALPLTASGKVNFQALPPPDGSRIDGNETFMAPRNPIESKMAGIWSKLLGLDRVGVRDNFFDLGGHSLLAVRLFAEIEKTFEKRPPLASLFQEPTIEYLAALIHDNTSETKAPPSSLISIQPEGTKRPIFCVHTFFGDVLCYMNLARHLGSDQPFYAIEARGANGIDEPFDDIKAMAAYYIEQIRVVQPEGPYALAGLCSAGIVAFEMAQQLRAKGDQVAMVALFDSQARLPSDERAGYKPRFRDLIKDIPSWLIGSLELNRSQWVDLVKLKVRIAKAKKAICNGTDGGLQNHTAKLIEEWGGFYHFSEHHLRIARAQSRALRQYQPQVYPGRLTLFKARMQPLFSSHRPDKGWGGLAGGGLDIHVVPGNQLAMLKEPHVRVLAEQLSDLLA